MSPFAFHKLFVELLFHLFFGDGPEIVPTACLPHKCQTRSGLSTIPISKNMRHRKIKKNPNEKAARSFMGIPAKKEESIQNPSKSWLTMIPSALKGPFAANETKNNAPDEGAA